MKNIIAIFTLSLFACQIYAQIQISVDVSNEIKEISPYIYGRNNNLSDDPAKPVSSDLWQFYKDVGIKFMRESSGNNSTKYNWRKKLSSHPNWYNNVEFHDWDYAATSLHENMPEIKGMWAFQLLGYVGNSREFNFDCWNYNQCVWTSDVELNWCAGGDYTKYLKEWPADSTVAILDHWFNTLNLDKEQLQYWNMDNEPEVWNSTHDDVMPNGISAEEYIAKYVAVAVAARTEFPEIKIVGPVFNNEWQWYNWQSGHDVRDPVTNKRISWGEYFIKRIAEEQERTGLRLLDVLDFHFYPEFRAEDNSKEITLQLHRIFYDEEYEYPLANGVKILDDSEPDWEKRSKKEYIWKRSEAYLNQYLGENHGVTMGLSEYGNYDREDPNVVAVNYASMLGTFAENNVEIFSPWEWHEAMWEVMHLFTRYAGTTSVASTSSQDLLVSAYSSINERKDTLTIVLVNRDMDNAQTISTLLQNGTTDKEEVAFYRLSNLRAGEETFVSKDENALEKGFVEIDNQNHFEITLPKLSVTAVQIPLKNSSAVACSDVLSNRTFNLYPNPVKNQTKLFAEGVNESSEVIITNLLGSVLKVIHVEPVNSKIETTIDVSNFADGVYYVQLRNGSTNKSRKLIIK